MKPITREEYYLAKIAGTWQGKTPEPVTIEEYYLATMAGDYSGNTPQPVTRLQYYMAKAAGVWGGSIPAPVTRLEYYWAAIAGKEGHIPDPVTRQEYLLYAISQSNNDVINTVSGSTIIIADATEGRPFRGLRVFGKSTQDGAPTPEAPVPIVSAGESGNITVEVRGKNLLTGRLYFTNYSSNASYVYNEDEVTLPYTPPSETRGIGYVVPCKPGVQYTFSVTNPNKNWHLGIAEYRNFEQAKSFLNKIGYQYGSEKSSIKYTAVGNGVLVCMIAGKWTDGKTTIHECTESELLQLEIGSEATTYEPYRTPQILTLQTPNGLPGVPVSKDGNYTDADGQQWICDEIDLGRGKYVQRVAEKEVSEITWSGAGAWGNTDDYKTLAFYAYIDGSNINEDWDAVKNYGICNYATITSNVFNNSIIGFTLGVYIAFRVPRSLLPDWDKNNPSNDPWVNWLKARKEAGNPVIVRYALKTPVERDLTPEEIAAYKALRTYGPTTVITNDAGAGMEVTYVAER